VLGFVVHTKGIVVRFRGGEWDTPSAFAFDAGFEEYYEWAYITPEGVIGEPHVFEVEVEE
jgi:hypothetical protein